MGEIIRSLPMSTLAAYHAFRDGRPDKERWELIDGVAMMMPPAKVLHQVLASNLYRMLERASGVAAGRLAIHETGVMDVDNDRYNPVPDIVVIDAAITADQVYATRFYAVAEILSESDTPALLAKKLDFYQGHAHCRSILLVEQERVVVRVLSRPADRWTEQVLLDPEAVIVVPELGIIGAVAEVYRRTPLMPA